MMEQIALGIGYFVMVAGLACIAIICLSLLGFFACVVWEAFSYRFRAILKAEKTIHEFRKNREKFMEWKERTEDGN